ncbi:CDP-diacylglycerol--inositol 3-phosphatidyltransferase-like [Lycorma delicatula]|uniref:CDP-diacylglycerol--inositol 3-phosphatidyltransferase-like n=1 Tax=Lycorma delicatula TaxID=130591 RepID=UPI003F5157A7
MVPVTYIMTTKNVLFFVPNIIGYVRLLLMFVSFYYMPFNYIVSSLCYVISGLLDAVDGFAARYFNQISKLGTMLDQLTDRCGTAGLCMTLSYFYPNYIFLFQLSIVIDISCHWIFFYSSTLQKKTSHKYVDPSWNPLLKLYYSSRFTLFIMCAGNEAFYASLYLLHFFKEPQFGDVNLVRIACYIFGPVAVLKSFISLLHGYVACCNVIIIDEKEREKICVE